jgi:hypothetical protein
MLQKCSARNNIIKNWNWKRSFLPLSLMRGFYLDTVLRNLPISFRGWTAITADTLLVSIAAEKQIKMKLVNQNNTYFSFTILVQYILLLA